MTELVSRSIPQFAAATNLYRLTSGRHVLITAPGIDQIPTGLEFILGGARVGRIEPSPTTIFLADEHGQPVDSDGDPTNGLTPAATFPPGTTHEQAVVEFERVAAN